MVVDATCGDTVLVLRSEFCDCAQHLKTVGTMRHQRLHTSTLLLRTWASPEPMHSRSEHECACVLCTWVHLVT
jgi:hypothetical protein